MKTADHATPLELATVEDLKHKLSILSKIYAGKENEDNWDAREKAARQFRGLLRGNKKWADTLAGGVHDMAEGIIQSVNSLRTTLATETLALVADIGTCIGYQLDSYTTENLLQTLFKCANSTRKIIATKSMDSTNTFLSTTPLRHKTLKLLSDMFKDKNMQTRQFAATYVKTILNTHGNNPVLEKSGGLDMIESCLIKGLSDAAPIVRDICRQIFRDVQERWPARAQKLLKRLDPTVQKQLGKITPPPPSTKQHKSASKLDFSKRSTVLPKLQRTTSLPAASSSSSSPSERRTVSPIPRSTSPSASKRRSSPVVTQDVTRDMVQILRSGNVDAISKTILQLEESLRDQPFDFTCATPLPPNIPSRIDLAPIFLEFLSSNTSVQLRETLTGWEFVAGVLPHIVDPHQYIPIYISHSNQNTSVQNPKESPVSQKKELYVEGLDKLKLLHGSRDSRLPARLLELLTAHIHSSIDEKYTLTMLQWIDEIICEYIGLAIETDPALRDSGKRWLVATEDVEPASKWFDSSEHVKLYLEKLLLLSNSIKTFPSLLGQISMIIGRLRLANEHVFESFSLKHGVALDEILNRQKEEHSQAQPVDQQEDDLDDVNSSVGSIRIDDDLALAETSATDKPHLATDTVDRDADGGEAATQRMPSDTFAHEQVEESEMIVDIDEPVLDFGSSPFKDNENKLQENNFDSQLISDLQVSRSESQVSVSETTETTEVMEKRSAPDDVSATRQKRRKLGSLPEDDKEQIRLLKHYTKGIQRPNEDEDIAFVTIQKLSEAKPVSTTDEVNSIHLWAGDRFFSLLEALIMVLVRSKSSDKLRLSALSLLGRLLQNQRGIIQQYEKMTTAVNESIVLILADALLSRIAHVDDEISSESQEVLAALLKIVATSTALQVLWFLLSENQNNHGKMNALLQLLHPVIERTDQDALRDCFKGENLEIFLKGINHNEPSVRRSTVQVLAKVQQTVGQEFLAANIYPLLQQEQVELIKFYVQQ